MGGKSAKASSRKSAAEIWKGVEEAQFHGVSLASLRKSWDGAKWLFDPTKAAGALGDVLPIADLRLGLAMFFAGGLLIFLLMLTTQAESLYMANFALETVAEITGDAMPQIDTGILAPIALYQFLLYVVFATAVNCAHEGLAFGLARASGGKGTFGRQFYLSSVVWMAVAYSLSATLLAPLFCLGYLGILSVVLVSFIYLMLYTGGRAYSVAHGISLPHGILIALIFGIPRIAVLLMATNLAASMVGLPQATGA